MSTKHVHILVCSQAFFYEIDAIRGKMKTWVPMVSNLAGTGSHSYQHSNLGGLLSPFVVALCNAAITFTMM
jgi:hypothetical protein